ncbi:dynein axonemal intermediate chain 7 isoform X2 [Ranitomeya variabilis]|uniref:dynein axonemal intermediate chain 7 isoform X2 n=1 Tax=Ranitomeya variabilis TaxID=490064 RepID=UPI0040568D54
MSSKGTSASSRKKGKPSKVEKQRLQKEEEERRQREEEEARFLAEQIEAARLEKERLEREELERLEAKQREHREEELGEHRALLEEKLEAAARWKKDLRTRSKWDRYMLCDGSPDPTVPQEINTFMSLWSDESEEDVESTLRRSCLVLSLIAELESLLADTPRDELGEAGAAEYTHTTRQLQALLQRKFDDATELLLKSAAALSDIDTGNMQKVVRNETVSLCIWANLNKNPRFRGHHFQEEEMAFDLPKPLALSNIAVRILHTDYDHLSCLSPTFLPPAKEPEVPEGEARDWRPAEEEDDGKPAAESDPAPMEEVTSEERKSVLSAATGREDGNEPEEVERESPAGDPSEGRSPTPTLNEAEEETLEADVLDLRQFSSLGGVYYFDVLVLPPQRKQVNGWSMVQLLAGGLQKFPYPQESLLSCSLGVSLQEKDMEGLRSPPVGVSIKVPHNVIFFEDPQVARWDPESLNWKTDGVMNVGYKAEARELTFSMDAFSTFTLVQESHLHMPYESWELSPRGHNEASLTIATACTDIRIEVKEEQCRLAAVSGVDADLTHVTGRWTTPLRLKAEMRRVGLNVFPAEDSGKYVSVNKKNEQVETMAYKEMALLSPSFTFAWSKWNHSCGHEQIVVKVREGSGSCSEDDWSLYMLSPQRTQRLKVSESSERFSAELYEGSEFHSSLYHMVRDYCSPEATARLPSSHPLFIACVYELLSATRLLSFS